MSHYKLLLFLLFGGCIFFLNSFFLWGEKYWKKSVYKESREKYIFKTLTFDGVELSFPFYGSTSKLRKKNPLLLFFPTGNYYDKLREHLALEFSEDFHILLVPDRRVDPSKILGQNYLSYRKKQNKRDFILEKIYYKKHLDYDYIAFEEQVQSIKNKNSIAILTHKTFHIITTKDNLYKLNMKNYVILSPSEKYLQKKYEKQMSFLFQAKQILWLGANHEKSTLKLFQKKYKGNIKTYRWSAGSYQIFFRYHSAMSDLKNWIASIR